MVETRVRELAEAYFRVTDALTMEDWIEDGRPVKVGKADPSLTRGHLLVRIDEHDKIAALVGLVPTWKEYVQKGLFGRYKGLVLAMPPEKIAARIGCPVEDWMEWLAICKARGENDQEIVLPSREARA